MESDLHAWPLSSIAAAEYAGESEGAVRPPLREEAHLKSDLRAWALVFDYGRSEFPARAGVQCGLHSGRKLT